MIYILYALLILAFFGGLITYISIRKKLNKNITNAKKAVNNTKEKMRNNND